MTNQNLPIFSVVIPIYNVQRYITDCIDSVLEQTFSNFEIICVNDGCTDQSINLVEQYQDSRIRVIRQNNQGLAAARNTGINHSRGIFVALLDADDYWENEKLAAHYKHLQKNPSVDVSYCGSKFVSENGQLLGMGQSPKLSDIDSAHIFCRNPVGNGSAAVVRKTFLMRCGNISVDKALPHPCYFDESLRQSEDIEFWLRISLEENAKFEGIPMSLSCYRVNASGLSAQLDKQFRQWQRGMEKLAKRHPDFFDQWYSLALAYQQRYLARRAISSGESMQALAWIHRALATDIRILRQEPSRTLLTYAAALCCCLPRSAYQLIQKFAIESVGSHA